MVWLGEICIRKIIVLRGCFDALLGFFSPTVGYEVPDPEVLLRRCLIYGNA